VIERRALPMSTPHKIMSAALALALLGALSVPCVFAQAGSAPDGIARLSLDGAWEFSRAGTTDWHAARVPGCVHTDLLTAGLIPDPFVGTNELAVRWVEDEGWVYRRSFDVPDTLLGYGHIELVAAGLDTFARIFVNGKRAGETENMFRTYRFDLKPFLKKGRNDIRVEFDSPVKRERALEARLAYKLPGEAPHIRKAPYHFGWDWGPRLATSGIWRPLGIEAWSGARFRDLEVVQEFPSGDKGPVILRFKTEAVSDDDRPTTLKVLVDGVEVPAAARAASLTKGLNLLETTVRIEKPRLWWPAGMGEQNLTRVEARLECGGRTVDSASRRIGLRTLVLVQRPDRWGKSFYFSANGVPFFAKGANWIPADSFPSRVTPAKYRHLLHAAVEANMNMLRVWGGGIYEAPEFYDLCDELGLVVWQDFMFACAMYPGDEAFRSNVRAEAADVVKALRHHPSIGLWCGNNECEEGWFHWGWRESLPASVWADYEEIFERILPDAVASYDEGRAYWPSSPHSETTGDPRSEKSGDMHYWGVWHGQEPFEEFRKKFHRFFSEFGFQSFPLLATVRTFAGPGDWNLTSPVMEQHQKHPAGNRLILQYMLDEYRMPKDFESLLWLSQVVQAGGMKTAAEHFRSQRPRVMGALYWQFEDCWPVASWAGIDSTGAWKALHYYARRFYAPVLVAPAASGDDLIVSVASDLRATRGAEFEWRTTTYDGKRIDGGAFTVKLEPLESKLIFTRPLAALRKKEPPEKVYFSCELKDRGEVLSSNVYHFARLKRVDLPVPCIKASVTGEGASLLVHLETDVYAKDVHLAAPGAAGRFLDNFVDLVPDHPVRVIFIPEGDVAPAALESALKIRSLRDSY
jgi:beta-mannosidase